MRVWLAAVAAALVVPVMAAQQGGTSGQSSAKPQDPATQPPVFRTGTNLVRVDVTVSNRSGIPITDLTAEDFEVRENGKPQAITSFKLVEANGQPTDDYSLPIRSAEHAAAEAARDDVRVFVIFWDEYHIGEFDSALRAREQLTRFVLEAFGPTDLVALMDPLTPLDYLRFTRDRRDLAEQIRRLKGRRGVYVPPRSVVEENHLRDRQGVERSRAQVTTSALKSVVSHLGALREGPKSVLLVSEALGPLGSDETRVLSDLIETAGHNNTTVFTFDPRGLQVGSRRSGQLDALAYGTGGRPHSTNDMTIGLKRVVARASAFYLLGYTPEDSPMDGKFRRIAVRVKRGGFDVQARKGYWQLRAEELAKARDAAAAAVLHEPIAAALAQLTPANSHRPVDLWAGFSPGAGGRVAVTVAWAPRARGADAKEQAAVVEIEASLDGVRVFKGPAGPGGATFEAPAAGDLRVIATVLNAAGDILDEDRRTLVVPDVSSAALAFATPAVYRVRTPLDARAIEAGQGAISATRDFVRTDRLRVLVALYGTHAEAATVTASLLGPRGATLVDLPITRAGSRAGVDLPLSSVAIGEYLVRIGAVHGEDRAEALVALRVLR